MSQVADVPDYMQWLFWVYFPNESNHLAQDCKLLESFSTIQLEKSYFHLTWKKIEFKSNSIKNLNVDN